MKSFTHFSSNHFTLLSYALVLTIAIWQIDKFTSIYLLQNRYVTIPLLKTLMYLYKAS